MLEALRRRPLLVVAPAFLAGAAAGRFSWVLVAAALAVALLTIILRLRPALFVISWAVLAFGVGAWRMKLAETPEPDDLISRTLDEETTLTGRVSEVREAALALSDVGDRHGGSYGSFVLEVEGPVHGRARVSFYKPVALVGGERVRVTGHLRSPREPSNPGQFDRRLWLRRQGIGATLTMKEFEVLEGPSLLPRIRATLRRQLDRSARPEVAAFMSSLLIGQRDGLPDDLRDQLQRSGTAHFLAVSGFNVMVVASAAFAFLVLIGVSGRTRTVLLITIVILYALVTGLQVSVVRAALMAVLWLSADLVGRRRDSISALAASAFIVVLVDPMQLHDVSFQLSFLAVLGILLVAPVWAGFLSGLRSRPLIGGLSVSLAAWMATVPIVQGTFHLITPCILVANLLFYPLILVEMGAGALTMLLAPVGLGGVPAWIGGVAFDALLFLSKGLTAVPYSHVYVPAPPGAMVILYFAGLAAWAWGCRKGWRPALALLLLVPLVLPAFARRTPRELTLHVLDVGRGSCAFVEFPDGRNFVYDAGSLDYRDAGESVAAPYLWSRGVTRVDTLILSHADADHINGARSLIDRLRVRMIVTTRYVDAHPEGHALLEWARRRGVEVVLAERGPLAPGIEVMGPPVWERYGTLPRSNETSLVLRIDGRILLCGDIEELGTRALLDGGGDVAAEVLVVPHHGKPQVFHEELADRVAPALAIVSGPGTYADARVLAALRRRADLRVTGMSGAIVVRLGAGLAVWTYR